MKVALEFFLSKNEALINVLLILADLFVFKAFDALCSDYDPDIKRLLSLSKHYGPHVHSILQMMIKSSM